MADDPANRTDLQLLARIKSGDAPGDPREIFANIIELGPRAARLEAARPLELGARLLIEVVFPGQRHYASPRVPLRGIVRKVDDDDLHYDVELTALAEEARERLLLFLSWSGGAGAVRRAEATRG